MCIVKNRQSETVCDYWYSTIFVALARNRGCIVTLEGNVVHKQYKKSATHIIMSTLLHKAKTTQQYNWHSTNN